MFRHKPRVDEIPDFKGFLVYLEQVNQDLYHRYEAQLRKTMVLEILLVSAFVGAIAFGLVSFYLMFRFGYFSPMIISLLVLFLTCLGLVVVFSVLGRKGHARAFNIESEIVVEYNNSGFSGT